MCVAKWCVFLWLSVMLRSPHHYGLVQLLSKILTTFRQDIFQLPFGTLSWLRFTPEIFTLNQSCCLSLESCMLYPNFLVLLLALHFPALLSPHDVVCVGCPTPRYLYFAINTS